jgi:dienelactone hydrolase
MQEKAVIRASHRAIALCVGALLLASTTCAQAQPVPSGFESVEIDVPGPRAAAIKAYLRRPNTDKPVPAIVAMHGCGGLFRVDGRMNARETAWADHLVRLGYAVLFPDSFNPRGLRQICTIAGADRPIRPRHRAMDANAAAAWLSRQPFVDNTRLALLGWSHGGSSVLSAVDKGPGEASRASFRAAIAFYPGCRVYAERADYGVRMPLTILIGDADDWTPPEPCRELAKRPHIKLIEYQGAVHGFDAPDTPRRTLSGVGLSARGDGKVEVGTDLKARAAAIEAVTSTLGEAFKPRGDK